MMMKLYSSMQVQLTKADNRRNYKIIAHFVPKLTL